MKSCMPMSGKTLRWPFHISTCSENPWGLMFKIRKPPHFQIKQNANFHLFAIGFPILLHCLPVLLACLYKKNYEILHRRMSRACIYFFFYHGPLLLSSHTSYLTILFILHKKMYQAILSYLYSFNFLLHTLPNQYILLNSVYTTVNLAPASSDFGCSPTVPSIQKKKCIKKQWKVDYEIINWTSTLKMKAYECPNTTNCNNATSSIVSNSLWGRGYILWSPNR